MTSLRYARPPRAVLDLVVGVLERSQLHVDPAVFASLDLALVQLDRFEVQLESHVCVFSV